MTAARKLLYSALLLGMLAILAEGGLRLLGIRSGMANWSHLDASQYITDPHPGVPYLSAPVSTVRLQWSSNSRGYFDSHNGLTVTLNRGGFRGDHAKTETVILGDSFGWGWGVKDEHTAAALLGAANFSVPGFDTTQEVALFEAVVLPLKPKTAILWYFLNDAVPQHPTLRQMGGNDRFLSWRRSRLLDLLLTPIDRLLGERRLRQDYPLAYEDGRDGWERVKTALARFGIVCRDHHVAPVIVIHPMLLSLDAYPFAEIHQRIAAAATSAGLKVIDLLPAFTGQNETQLWVHPADQHPNEIAHRIAAEFVRTR